MGQDSSWDVVDADEIKKSIPGYDPKNPGRVHSESVRRAFQQVRNNQQSGKPFIWDVTGVNQQLPGTIRDLKRAGFEVDIMHVDVSQATATARNASRTRQVPSHVISNTSSMLPGALQDLKRAADNVLAIDNE
jgi:predicted kinase